MHTEVEGDVFSPIAARFDLGDAAHEHAVDDAVDHFVLVVYVHKFREVGHGWDRVD